MMSTPGWSASGKARPQSISSRAPAYSMTAQLRPISPSPPRKTTRAAGSATGAPNWVQADLGEQAMGEGDLLGGGVDQGWTQRPGGQAEQVHGRLEQDRAGGGEEPLEQRQVAQVQVERGGGVAPLEGDDQFLEGRADQVCGDADHADAADGEQRQEVLVVAGVLLEAAAGVAAQAARRGHVSDGVLDPDDVVHLGQTQHGVELDGDCGAAGNVVEQARQAGGAGDSAEVHFEAGLWWLVVVG